MRNAVCHLINSIRAWSLIALKVQEAVVDFQETVRERVLGNSSDLTKAWTALAPTDRPIAAIMLLRAQHDYHELVGYLLRHQEQPAANALRENKKNLSLARHIFLNSALKSFATSLDTYVEGLQEVTTSENYARKLVHQSLMQLENEVSASIEHCRKELMGLWSHGQKADGQSGSKRSWRVGDLY